MDHSLKITGLEIYQYRLPLRKPFTILNEPMSSREGLIIRLITADGLSGVGEAAPLPGFSEETLKKAAFQLKNSHPLLVGLTIPFGLQEFREVFNNRPFAGHCASVRFGIETAVLHLMSQDCKKTPGEMFGCGVQDDIQVAGLVQGTPEEIKSQVPVLIEQGFRVLKLKIGNRNIPLDVKKVQLVRELADGKATLRLDANRAWSFDEAMAFCQNTGRDGIEFIEEPLKDISDLQQWTSKTDIPVALDESIQGADPEKFNFTTGVHCVVIKPTLTGGILKSLDWMAKASKEKKEVVISSAFESGVAGRMLAHLSGCSQLAAGLGTEDWFSADLLKPLRQKNSSVISKTNLSFRWEDIDFNQLTPVQI